MQTLIRRRSCPSPGFTNHPLYTALRRHSDTNSAAINNRYLVIVLKLGWISLVNDNNVDNNLQEILVYVYFGSILSNEPKNAASVGMDTLSGETPANILLSSFWNGICSEKKECTPLGCGVAYIRLNCRPVVDISPSVSYDRTPTIIFYFRANEPN